jgi:hypothetical protein
LNYYDQFYALHIFEKATTKADKYMFAVAILAVIVLATVLRS